MNTIVYFTQICTYCNEVISPGSVVVIANRAGSGNVWHPQCFRYVQKHLKLIEITLLHLNHFNTI